MALNEIEVVGVGDLHFDCGLKQHLPRINEIIVGEIQTALTYAKRNGIKTVVFYGDIAHKPLLSVEATLLFLQLLMEYPDLKFYVMMGNHDVESTGVHSLRLLKLIGATWFPNLKVVDEPKVFKVNGCRLNILPWPHVNTQRDALNFIHVEINGARWDTGRDVVSDIKINRRHFTAAGHIHTHQTVGNVHFSGTLYQTNFGEKLPKFFHHLYWNQDDEKGGAKLVPHKPRIELRNVVIEEKADAKLIPDDPNILVKLYVKNGVELSNRYLDLPNVVNAPKVFRNSKELETILQEDLALDDEGFQGFDDKELLKEFLSTKKVERQVAKQVMEIFDTLKNKGSLPPVSDDENEIEDEEAE